MKELSFLRLAGPDDSLNLSVWQVKDGDRTLGHIIASDELVETLRDGLELLVATTALLNGGRS